VHRESPRATAAQRCEMIELALAGETRMRLNRLEIERGGPSYTVDSLREIRRNDDRVPVLLLGVDAFNGFAGWKAPEEILQLANLAVCLRPGIEVDRGLYAGRRVDSAAALAERCAGAILMLEVDAPDCASSSLREAFDAGHFPLRCLHPGVAEYIRNQHLYRRPGD